MWFEIKDGHYTNLMITRPFFWGNNQEVFKLLAFLRRTGLHRGIITAPSMCSHPAHGILGLSSYAAV